MTLPSAVGHGTLLPSCLLLWANSALNRQPKEQDQYLPDSKYVISNTFTLFTETQKPYCLAKLKHCSC